MRNIAVILLLISSLAHADLYDRVRLEDSLRERIESHLKSYDNDVRALVRFDYRSYRGTLPGTNIETEETITPVKIESSDISRVTIQVFTTQPELNAEARELVYKLLPFERSKIYIDVKTIDSLMKKEIAKTLDAQTLSTIIKTTSDSVSTWLLSLTLICLVSGFAFAFYLNHKRMSEFKSQMKLIAQALTDVGGPTNSLRSLPEIKDDLKNPNVNSTHQPAKNLENLSSLALRELIADCYWTHHDSYAAWIWRNLTADQRRELFSQVHFIRDYSRHIVAFESKEENFHEHPYYLDPTPLWEVSQDDLLNLVKEDVRIWKKLSPLRQSRLQLPLEAKLQALQASDLKEKFSVSRSSGFRNLQLTTFVGDISFEDEKSLFEKPDMVPETIKSQVQSLVWLAHKPDDILQTILEKYDARSLAAAWVGPQEVLNRLENCLPEKKLKLLKTYRSKITPSRNSQVFQQLLNEGLRHDEAA